jgi:tetratricopeptide (TPR) repeat protein
MKLRADLFAGWITLWRTFWLVLGLPLLVATSLGLAHLSYGQSFPTDPDRDIAEAEAALQRDPNDAQAYYKRGWAYLFKGDYTRALSDLDEVTRIDPKLVPAYVARCRARAQLQQKSALDDCNEAIALKPHDASIIETRGSAYSMLVQFDEAIADYDEALRIDPSFALSYVGRGDTYGAKGDLGRAMADYSEAIQVDPKLVIAYTARAGLYRMNGDTDRAIADSNEAIRLDPKNAVAYFGRGEAYFKGKGDPDRGIADFDEAIQLSPKLPISGPNAIAFDTRV